MKTPEEFLKEISPDDNLGVRADLQKYRMRGVVCTIMKQYADHVLASSLQGKVVTDEEINVAANNKAALRPYSDIQRTLYRVGFRDCAKWMREQLTKKQ